MNSYSLDEIATFECLQCEVRDKVMNFTERLCNNQAIPNEELKQFAVQLTDYLTNGTLLLNHIDFQEYPLQFSDKYAKGSTVDNQTLKSDLGKLIDVLSNRWEMENKILERLHAEASPERQFEATRP